MLALALLALNPGVPAEQAAAQEVFELRGDFDVTLLEAGTLTANEITLLIPADGGDVSGTYHLRLEEFPFVLDLFGGCFNLFAPVPAGECESEVPFPDCTITLELSGGVLTGAYNADSSQLDGTAVYIASLLDPTNCPPDFVESQEQLSATWEGSFDEELQFARGTIGDSEDSLEFSLAVVGSSGGQPTEDPETEPTPTEEPEAEPTPTEEEAEQAVLDSLFGGIDLTAEQRARLKEDASEGADRILRLLVDKGSVGEPTPLQRESVALLGLANGLRRQVSPEGNLFPSFSKAPIMQVVVKLFNKSFGWDRDQKRYNAGIADPEARVALERFIHLVAAMDQAARTGGGQ